MPKLTNIGSPIGARLTKEAQNRGKTGIGDAGLRMVPSGGRAPPTSTEFERQMSLADMIMQEDCDILRALAK